MKVHLTRKIWYKYILAEEMSETSPELRLALVHLQNREGQCNWCGVKISQNVKMENQRKRDLDEVRCFYSEKCRLLFFSVSGKCLYLVVTWGKLI